MPCGVGYYLAADIDAARKAMLESDNASKASHLAWGGSPPKRKRQLEVCTKSLAKQSRVHSLQTRVKTPSGTHNPLKRGRSHSRDVSAVPFGDASSIRASSTTPTSSFLSLLLPSDNDPGPGKAARSKQSITVPSCISQKIDRIDLLLDCPRPVEDLQRWLYDAVVPPWVANGKSVLRVDAIQELRRANPLSQHLGHCSLRGFYAFMVERELIRIRRHELRWPQAWWTGFWPLQRVRFTNVKRAEDRASQEVITQAAAIRQVWAASAGSGNLPWSTYQEKIAGNVIFTVALWRAFGTALAICNIRMSVDWDAARHAQIACTLVEAAFAKFQHMRRPPSKDDDFCITRAYAPARNLVDKEIDYIKAGDRESLRNLYLSICRGSLTNLYKERLRLGHVAQRGPRALTESIMRVPGFGGTGFIAKEITEDVKLCGILDSSAIPKDVEWAMPGPGGRRGCNRLLSRKVSQYVNIPNGTNVGMAAAALKDFQAEMRKLWDCRVELWPSSKSATGVAETGRPDLELLLESNLGEDLECSDIQFQLCEFDKFQRALEACHGDLSQVLAKLTSLGLRMFRRGE